jgi:hypothetical protein
MSNIDKTLYTAPRNLKDENQATFQVFEPNSIHQADLLFLPTEKFGFKYALVVVDTNNLGGIQLLYITFPNVPIKSNGVRNSIIYNVLESINNIVY